MALITGSVQLVNSNWFAFVLKLKTKQLKTMSVSF